MLRAWCTSIPRFSIPGVRWVGEQLRLSTPVPWRKQGRAGEALQGNGP